MAQFCPLAVGGQGATHTATLALNVPGFRALIAGVTAIGRTVGAVVGAAALLGSRTALAADAGAGGAAARPLAVATRVPARPPGTGPAPMGGVFLGEGWGCAHGAAPGDDWQCWEAGPRPQAFRVPRLKGHALQVAPDHLCELQTPVLAFRCWQRPRAGDVGPHELPASWQWLNPHDVGWNDAYKRGDRIGRAAAIGGTFSCLQTTRDEGVFCLGDDRFGQLGSSSVPGPDARKDDPAFVKGLWPAMFLTAGTWHACALAAPYGMGRGANVTCWGRGDVGQLGGPAPDKCMVGGQPVACARTPVTGPAVPGMAVAKAGDMFTCVTTEGGIECWGACRDAFFGVPGSCPESLRRAWPTLGGPVPAPRAACSTKPVRVAGVEGFNPNFSVYPRGICVADSGRRRCIGGFAPDPRGVGVGAISYSPGSDASACGVRAGAVVCWGERYSPPGAQAETVPVAVAPAAPLGETAIATTGDAGAWAAGCLVRRGCAVALRAAPRCAAGIAARPADAILADASKLVGTTVHARGPLGLGVVSVTGVGCGPHQCCNTTTRSVAVGAGARQLPLGGLGCVGDDSASCCNAPAFGQTVVATGRLEADPDGVTRPGLSDYRLADVTLCTP
jgi:hypothetical protein